MTRSSPSILGASDLSDISLRPSAIRRADVTIHHPQLRDLVLPLAKGHVLYPNVTNLNEERWGSRRRPSARTDDMEGGDHNDEDTDEGDDDTDGDDERDRQEGSSNIGQAAREATSPYPSPSPAATDPKPRTVVKLGFAPTCLTTSGSILACGGQKGELYLCDLPSVCAIDPMLRAPRVRPFSLSITLPRRTINNAITILPSYPARWAERQAETKRRYGYDGFVSYRQHDMDEDEHGDDDMDAMSDATQSSDDGSAAMDDDDMDVDSPDDATVSSLGLGVATYPNSMPFGNPPRIQLSGSRGIDRRWSTTSTSTSTTAVSATGTYAASHGSHASASSTVWTVTADGATPSYYSPPRSHVTGGSAVDLSEADPRTPPGPGRSHHHHHHRRRSSHESYTDEPRILISNNDQTVKMFALRRTVAGSGPLLDGDLEQHRRSGRGTPLPTGSLRPFALETMLEHMRSNPTPDVHPHALLHPHQLLHVHRGGVTPPPPSRPFFSQSLGLDVIGIDDGILVQSRAESGVPGRRRHNPMSLQWQNPRRDRNVTGAGPSSTSATGSSTGAVGGTRRENEPRKLTRVGGEKFKLAVNHSSLSPDLKTMVTVGDSTDVFLYEVIDGGRSFRPIGVYSAATDFGFSTAWSKDGRKFAVASQDGQVTVWDHRSSNPLAIFYSSPTSTSGSPGDNAHLLDEYEAQATRLIDPVTGESRLGSSTSGREAARVVKFSPEGSSRDLLVFSEELSNIHIIDARTFNSYVVVPVPWDTQKPPLAHRNPRPNIDVSIGLSGVAFDPTGDWLYAGTERTVVEWDLRRYGGGEGGTWSLA